MPYIAIVSKHLLGYVLVPLLYNFIVKLLSFDVQICLLNLIFNKVVYSCASFIETTLGYIAIVVIFMTLLSVSEIN